MAGVTRSIVCKGLHSIFQLSLPIFGYIIYFAFVFGYVEKRFGRLGGALASLKEVYWYIINSHLLHLTFLVFSFFSVGGGHGLAWSARHAWQKRGKNITHNSNNYFFNLFVITHVWCCLPMSALHLPSLVWKMRKKSACSAGYFLLNLGKEPVWLWEHGREPTTTWTHHGVVSGIQT